MWPVLHARLPLVKTGKKKRLTLAIVLYKNTLGRWKRAS